MKTLDEYKALVQKKYRLTDEIDIDWCDGAYEILNELNELSDCLICPDAHVREKALEIIHDITFNFKLPHLDFALAMAFVFRSMQDNFCEKDIYEYFIHKYKDFLGADWSIVERHNDNNNKPDFWVFDGVEYVPVECKLKYFDKRAKSQLVRYMNNYDCKHGIAVACELKTDLPDNIKFIQIDISDLRGFIYKSKFTD